MFNAYWKGHPESHRYVCTPNKVHHKPLYHQTIIRIQHLKAISLLFSSECNSGLRTRFMAKKSTGLGRGLDSLLPTNLPGAPTPAGINEIPINQIEVNQFQPRNKFDEDYYTSLPLNRAIENPKGSSRSFYRQNNYAQHTVIKGGSFLCNDSYCASYRVSAKMPLETDSAMNHVGFRCVADVK